MSLGKQSTTQLMVSHSETKPDAPLCLNQHTVLQITLTGPALVFAILSIIISIQILHPSLTCTLIALSPLPWIIHNDYENFLSLGPGGTPATFIGYLKITYLRLFALSDPYSPPSFTDRTFPSVGYYQRSQSWLPKRNGPRPTIAGIVPHRQLDQPGSPDMYQALRTSLENIAVKHPDSLRTGTSCFEKKGLALFAQNEINGTCMGEVVHVHHTDQSMHMSLHPDDAKVVLERGWGQRHPLARGGWLGRYVPREFIMVYAPRDLTELDVVCRIIEAAAFWVTGEQYDLTVEKDVVLEERKH